MPAPPLCKQGLGFRVPLAPPLSAALWPPELTAKDPSTAAKYSNSAGLRAARRAPSTLAKSSRWSLGCIHPSSPRSGCGAVSAWPPAGGHQGQRAKTRRPCGWHAPPSQARPSTPGLESAVEVAKIERLAKFGRDHQTRLVPCHSPGPESSLEFEPTLQSANSDFGKRQGRSHWMPPSCAQTLSAGLTELSMGVERVASNHQDVDFAGPIEDLEGLAVSKQSLHAAAVVDAQGTEDLDRFDGVPHGRVGAE
jgi:hypothetical protein